MTGIIALWDSKNELNWKIALDGYWDYIKPENLKLEQSLNKLRLKRILDLGPDGWYHFLHDEFFPWKYTAPNRLKTTTTHFEKYIKSNQLEELHQIKKKLLALDMPNIRKALSLAKEIHGLGIAGASSLLSLMYPHSFGSVDQFVVKALRDIPSLPERDRLRQMNPEGITLSEGVTLIRLMRYKAAELNYVFATDDWTPRKIDMVLWGTRE